MTSAATSRPVLRLSTAAEIVEALPYLVGFEPEESLVVVALRGARSRVTVTLRIDLPGPDWAEECVRQVVGHLRQHHAERAIVATYSAAGGPDHATVRLVHDALAERLARAGIERAEALVVHDGRWWSLVCAEPRCCPPEGTAIGGGEPGVAAAMALEGRAVLPSRESLGACLLPVQGLPAQAMAYALPRAAADLAARAYADPVQVERESLARFEAAVDRRLRGDHRPLDVDEAARLIVGLDDTAVRDELLLWFDGDRGEATLGLFRELVPRAVPPFHVVPLTLLAWLSYLTGGGALASMAVERALAADPAYGLARILDDALVVGIDPAVFRAVHTERVAADRVLRGGDGPRGAGSSGRRRGAQSAGRRKRATNL